MSDPRPPFDDVERGPKTSLRRVVDALESTGGFRTKSWTGQDAFNACCPVHDDSRPSLAVRWVSSGGRGQVVLRCHGCHAEYADLCAALGLRQSDLFDEAQERRTSSPGGRVGRSPQQRRAGQRRGRLGRLPKLIPTRASPEPAAPEVEHTWAQVAVYPYVGADGALVQEVLREQCTSCPAPHKQFRQQFVDASGRRRKTKPAGFTPVLYRLPQVLAAVAAGQPVWLLEGEKDVEVAEGLGLVATTNTGGGRGFGPELARQLQGTQVRVVLDRDDTGWARGVAAHQALTAAGAAPVLLLPAPTEAKADFADHIAAGHRVEDLLDVHVSEVEAWSAAALVRVRAEGVEQALQQTQAQLARALDGGAGEKGAEVAEEAVRFATRWAVEAEMRHEALDSAVDTVRDAVRATGTAWADQALDTATQRLRAATTAARTAVQLVGAPLPPKLQLSHPAPEPDDQPAAPKPSTPVQDQVPTARPPAPGDRLDPLLATQDHPANRPETRINQPVFRIVENQIVQVEPAKGRRDDEDSDETLRLILGLGVRIVEMEYLEESDTVDVDAPVLRGRAARASSARINPPAPAELSGLLLTYIDPASGEQMHLRISADQWMDSTWLRSLPGPPDHDGKPAGLATVRRAITAVSPTILRTTRYRSTGWRQIDGEWVFVHAGGGITPTEVRDMPVLLTGPLARYDLPDPTADPAALRAAFVQHSAGMMTRLPGRIIAPLLGQVYRSALGPNPWVLAVIGSPGSYKTSVASLAMHHWGELWDRRKPASSMSGNGDTLNALRIKLNASKDALYWADDVAPTKDWLAAQKLLEEFARLVHNGEQRSRSTRDGLGVLDGTPPRASALVTSEVMPRPGSGAQRMLVVPIRKEEISFDALLDFDLDESRHGRALLMASFLQWIAADLTGRKARYAEEAAAYARQLRTDGEAVRQAEAIASTWSGWCAMADFLVEVGAITDDERAEVLARTDEALQQTADATADPDLPTRTGARVVELLRHALRTGLAFVDDVRDGEAPPWPLAGRLGWRRVATGDTDTYPQKFRMEARGLRFGYVLHDPDGRDGGAQLLVDSTALEQVLKSVAGTMADSLQLDRGTAIRALYDEGVLIAEERTGLTPRYTVQRTLHHENRRCRVTALRLWDLLGEEGPEDELQLPEPPDDGPDDELGADPGVSPRTDGVAAAAAALFGDVAREWRSTTTTAQCPTPQLPSPAPAQGLTSPTEEEPLMGFPHADAEGTVVTSETLEHPQPCIACRLNAAQSFLGMPMHLPCWWRSTASSRAQAAAPAAAEQSEPVDSLDPQQAAPTATVAPPTAAAETPTPAPTEPAAVASTPAAPAPRRRPSPDATFTAPAAVLHTDGIWTADGHRHDLPAQLTHVGHLAQVVHELNLGTQVTARRSEPGQLWVTAEALASLGVDVAQIPADPTERVEAVHGLTRGAELVTAAQAEGWTIGGSGDGLRAWTRVWRGEQRGVWIALIPAMNADPLEVPVLADCPSPATLARRLALFASQLQAPWAMGASATGIDLMISLRFKDRDKLFSPRKPVPPAAIATLEQDLNWSRVPTDDEREQTYLHAYDRGGSYAAGVAGLELGVGDAEHHPEGRDFDPKLPGYWKVEVPESGDWRIPHPLVPRGTMPAQPIWVTTPGLQLAWELGHQPQILAAYTWPEHSRVLDPWYERIRDARSALDTADPDAQSARDLLKIVYTRTIGMMGSEEWMRDRAGYDPARRHHIVAKARTNILRRVLQIGRDSDRWPVAITADTVLYASADPDPVTAWPGKPEQLGRGLGQFKPEASGLLVDQLPHLTGRGFKGKELLGPAGSAAGSGTTAEVAEVGQ